MPAAARDSSALSFAVRPATLLPTSRSPPLPGAPLHQADPAAGILRAALPLQRHRPQVELRRAIAEFRERQELRVRYLVVAGVVFPERRLEIGVRRRGARQRAYG